MKNSTEMIIIGAAKSLRCPIETCCRSTFPLFRSSDFGLGDRIHFYRHQYHYEYLPN